MPQMTPIKKSLHIGLKTGHGKAVENNRPLLAVQVLLPRPLAAPLDYAVPPEMTVDLGAYVDVPIGQQTVLGVVWSAEAPSYPIHKLKPITAVRPAPPMPATTRRFIDWVADYTMQPKGAVLKLALTADSAQDAPTQTAYRWNGTALTRRPTPARAAVMKVLEEAGADTPFSRTDLAARAGCSAAVVTGLIEAGVLEPITQLKGFADDTAPQLTAPHHVTFSAKQQQAVTALLKKVNTPEPTFSVTLLEGVTGSGKTEVYAEAMRAAMAKGQQVLVLFPEISLSGQMLGRFEKLFGQKPLLWHSDLSQSERRRVWRKVADGSGQIVIGARSALFLPFPQLGLLVVDEEHEAAYKQEEGVTYHARDMAIVRARLSPCPCLLVSATPSIETLVNVEEGRFAHLQLPNRHGVATLPSVQIVDLTKEPPSRGRWLSPKVVEAIGQTLARGEQVLLFLNRRGYAPLTLCRACGYRAACTHCTSWLVDHRQGSKAGKLVCHHCGTTQTMPTTCPACNAIDAFIACGPGVERIEEEVATLFPSARHALFTSDTPSTWTATQELLGKIEHGDVDIIIGTQIIAKGYHFPSLTLVVVVDGDVGLDGGELRARERAFQLLSQVGGRAGREALAGSVFVQTHSADNLLFRSLAKNDRAGFIAHEIDGREQHGLPPFTRLAALVVSGRDKNDVDNAAQKIRMAYTLLEGTEIFGPAPAPIAKLRDHHRVRLLLRTKREMKIQQILSDWLSRVTLPKGVDLKIIIDPVTFL